MTSYFRFLYTKCDPFSNIGTQLYRLSNFYIIWIWTFSVSNKLSVLDHELELKLKHVHIDNINRCHLSCVTTTRLKVTQKCRCHVIHKIHVVTLIEVTCKIFVYSSFRVHSRLVFPNHCDLPLLLTRHAYLLHVRSFASYHNAWVYSWGQ